MFALAVAYAVILLLAGVDQAIKVWAIDTLKNAQPRPFLPIGDWDWMHLCYVENNGAAFSMLRGATWFLVGMPIAMMIVCCVMLYKYGRTHRWVLFALPLLAGGGLGNLIDRILRDGYVVDYFDLQIFDFAIFNFADCCVSVGVVIMMFGLLFLEKEDPSQKRPARLPKRKLAARMPFARQCAVLPETEACAEVLPEAEALPEADVLPEADPLPDGEPPHA